jgi:hypothetical protein
MSGFFNLEQTCKIPFWLFRRSTPFLRQTFAATIASVVSWERIMRLAVALGVFLASSTTALSQDFCKDAPLGIFKFVRWEVKAADKHIVEISMTFHNNLDQSFRSASFGMNIFDKNGKWVKWQSLEVQEDVLAGVDHAEIYRLDAPPDLAEKLKGTTLVLCV